MNQSSFLVFQPSELKLIRCGYTLLLLLLILSLNCVLIRGGSVDRIEWAAYVISILWVVLLWIPGKWGGWAARSAATLLGVFLCLIGLYEYVGVYHDPAAYPQLNIFPYASYQARNILLALLFILPVVVMWLPPFRKRTILLQGSLFLCIGFFLYDRLVMAAIEW